MNVINVLHVFGRLDRGGAESRTMDLFRHIDPEILHFDFVVHTDDKCHFDHEVINAGSKIYRCPRFNGKNIVHYRNWWLDFLQSHQNDYQILHSHVTSTASIYIPIAKKQGMVTIAHSRTASYGPGIKSIIKKILQAPLKREADYFFGCSEMAGKWAFGKEIVNSDRYYTIANAIDTDMFLFDPEKRDTIRAEFNIGQKTVVFGHVGSFRNKQKNHLFLLSVFKGLKEKYPDSVLMLVGDGERKDEIISSIEEMGLTESVILTGVRSDVPCIMQAFDCFLFPSLWEGLPGAVIEAQAAGLPCYVSANVTREVKITDNVCFLPIDKGISVWVDAISANSFVRHNTQEQIKEAGYDIASAAKRLTDLYVYFASTRYPA